MVKSIFQYPFNARSGLTRTSRTRKQSTKKEHSMSEPTPLEEACSREQHNVLGIFLRLVFRTIDLSPHCVICSFHFPTSPSPMRTWMFHFRAPNFHGRCRGHLRWAHPNFQIFCEIESGQSYIITITLVCKLRRSLTSQLHDKVLGKKTLVAST